MRTPALAFALMLCAPLPAAAAMPSLSSLPGARTVEACQGWATSQSEDAREMWGMLPTGEGSAPIGTMRLTLHCLGDAKPEIVGVGSSVGYDEAFCRRHPATPLCRNARP